jgi:hypothetical protein
MKTINLRKAWCAGTAVVIEADSNTRQGPYSYEFHAELHRRLIGSHRVLEEVTARSIILEYSFMNLCGQWLSFDDSAFFLVIIRPHVEICKQRANR